MDVNVSDKNAASIFKVEMRDVKEVGFHIEMAVRKNMEDRSG
jgi:hypothetical protein